MSISMKKYLIGAGVVATSLLPLVSFAQNVQPVVVTTTNLDTAIRNITNTVNLLVPLMLAVAVIFFIYGVIKYIIAKGGEDAGKARSLIIWSVVGLAAILAVWGLARLLVNFFGLTPTTLDQGLIPTVPTTGIPNTSGGGTSGSVTPVNR
jgi:hypothetical protein